MIILSLLFLPPILASYPRLDGSGNIHLGPTTTDHLQVTTGLDVGTTGPKQVDIPIPSLTLADWRVNHQWHLRSHFGTTFIRRRSLIRRTSGCAHAAPQNPSHRTTTLPLPEKDHLRSQSHDCTSLPIATSPPNRGSSTCVPDLSVLFRPGQSKGGTTCTAADGLAFELTFPTTQELWTRAVGVVFQGSRRPAWASIEFRYSIDQEWYSIMNKTLPGPYDVSYVACRTCTAGPITGPMHRLNGLRFRFGPPSPTAASGQFGIDAIYLYADREHGRTWLPTYNPVTLGTLQSTGPAIIDETLHVIGSVGINTPPSTDSLTVDGSISGTNIYSTVNMFGRWKIEDHRDIDRPPSDYGSEMWVEFKTRTALGVPGSGTYGAAMTIAPYYHDSGDANHQLFFNEGGLYWRQGQPQSSSWGSWLQIQTAAPSDKQLKHHIEPFSGGLDLLKQIKPVTFQYNGEAGTQDNGDVHLGVIAQDIPSSLSKWMVTSSPSTVNGEQTDVMSVNPTPLHWVLSNAVNDLAQELEQLKNTVRQLQSEINKLNEKC